MTKEQNGMRKFVEKNAGGITLIALVVTIVVLIILAGVAINLSLGNNGLFNKAKQAREDYKVATNEEQSGIANLENAMDELTGKKETKVNIGDYIDYPIDLNNNGKPDDWMIFYIADGNAEGEEAGGAYAENVGDYYIIAADYLENTDSRLKLSDIKAQAYNKNGVCWYDSSGIVTGTALQENEKNLLFMANKYNLNRQNSNSRVVSTILNVKNWNEFVDSNYADFAIGAPTLEMFVASWNKKYGDKLYLYTNMNETGYYVGTEINTTNTESVELKVVPEAYQDKSLYFPSIVLENANYGYLLAAPSAADSTKFLTVNVWAKIHDELHTHSWCLRPVVHLKPDIQLEKNFTTGAWEKAN